MVYLIKLEKKIRSLFLNIYIIAGSRRKDARIRIIRTKASLLPALVYLMTIALAQ